ncbi:HAMP domain-containing sensor histidine kinase [Sphingomonas sp.]|jgi:signal transduction histidine kinase|uniref:sensor histidine kinase n=1 Tax=Sphingomonas sp. TaxID=28214 RepID=UPI002E32F9A6|nr:HAMP domain-containing sensor histidine kinase [Sphingomonas sp.]HEX4693089.1 HAMP domain-containing sensor histidine kinase [Sphingomonas sp.]
MGRPKQWLKAHWPALRLRTILFGTLLFTAALPGFGALFLRVYENTLVRQTETELIAQGAALVATTQALWPGAAPAKVAPAYQPEESTIDLRATPVLDERPPAQASDRPPDPQALAVARQIGPILATTENTTLASIQLIDRNGVVILGPEAGGSYARVPEVAAALRGRVGTVLRENGRYAQVYAFEWLSRASSLRIHHVRPIVVDGKVVGALLLSRSPRALFRGLYEDRGKIIFGIVVIFGLLLVITTLLSRGIARPVEALDKATRDVAAGTGVVPDTPTTAAVEIRQLFDNFRGMAAAIDRRSRYLRDFAASVSHEFKTPLAGISGAIELLEDHGEDMDPAERARFLANAKADAARLSQLVTRLLDLARADMATPDPAAAVDVLGAVRQAADAFASDGFAVTVEAPPALPAVAMPRATIDAVLGALLENARQAGADAVTIAAESRDGSVRIGVADDGPGIAPATAERIFEPFFTTKRASGGTGLGLAISASLLRAGGGSVALDPQAASGTRFVMTLPVSA